MKKNKLVSVIIPIHHTERYLDKCLVTITQQTYSNLEIVIVDDDQTNENSLTCNIWAKKDQRVKVFHDNKKDNSLNAWFWGLSKATGEYVTFVRPNDWISISMIRDLVTNIENTNAEMAACQSASILLDGRTQRNSFLNKDLQTFTRQEFLSYLLENNKIDSQICGKLYKRDIITNNVIFKGEKVENVSAITLITNKYNKIVCINSIGYFYRSDENIIEDGKHINAQLDALTDDFSHIKYIEPDLTNKASKSLILSELEVWRKLMAEQILYKESIKKRIRKDLYKFDLKNISGCRNKGFLWVIKNCPHLDKVYYKLILANKFYSKGKHYLHKLRLEKNLRKKLKADGFKFIILGYTHFGNLGDRALGFGEEQFIRTYFPEYKIIKISMEEFFTLKKLKKFVKSNDIVSLQAGGNIGTLYPNIHKEQEKALQNFTDKKMIVFPQTFFYAPNPKGMQLLKKTQEVYKTMDRFLVFVRDESSYNFVKQSMPFVNVELRPDMALMLANNDIYPKKVSRNGALILLRNDSEKTLNNSDFEKVLMLLNERFNHNLSQSDTHVYYDDLSNDQAKEKLKKLWNNMSSKELVVTDRLHGMVFAAITGTPCVVLQSKSPKVKGVYNWIKGCKYVELVENISDLNEAVGRVLQAKDRKVKMHRLNNEYTAMAQKIKEL